MRILPARSNPHRQGVNRTGGRPHWESTCDDGADPATVEASGRSSLELENRELRKRTKQLEQENEILRRATAYFARDTLPK